MKWLKTGLLALLPLLPALPVLAHGDHDQAAAPLVGQGPRRLPDGGVFLPKPAQRQLAVRTLPVEAATLPRTLELSGRVIMDPNAGGKVQALNAGRIEAGPRGLPSLGQAVRKGEVLAYVAPAVAPLDHSSQSAQLAELRAARALADKRLARLRELADTVPRKELEVAESEAVSLDARIAALGTGLSGREALVASASGVIASANAVAGQVVDARELVFEIVDPARLRVEALAYDAAQAGNLGTAWLAVGGQRVALELVGVARSLREQALPVVFRARGQALTALAVGQPVRVYAQTRERIQGLAVPVAAVQKNAANQNIVWVKTAAERFEPRTVTLEPLDGVQAVVTSGLKPGDRVAVQGATLINQIR